MTRRVERIATTLKVLPAGVPGGTTEFSTLLSRIPDSSSLSSQMTID
ncbi:MAG: hypothetical protein QGH29_12355 [Kiritimatiellia bacterium]|nr:hypothetical protein [Kiritimatiellia bacterium]